MRKITLNIKDDIFASLERDFKSFTRLSLKCDSQFVTPSLENFLLAKVSENMTPLTEEAVQHLMVSGQYAWAKRALDKEFPDVVAILIAQAAEYGFNIAIRPDWTPDDIAKAAKAWSTAIVKQAKGDESQIDVLAAQIKSAAVSITDVEAKMKTPSWRLGHALAQDLYDVKIAVEHAHGAVAREKFGHLCGLLRLGRIYGTVTKKEDDEIMEHLRKKKPYLFVEETHSVYDRIVAWFQSVFA